MTTNSFTLGTSSATLSGSGVVIHGITGSYVADSTSGFAIGTPGLGEL